MLNPGRITILYGVFGGAFGLISLFIAALLAGTGPVRHALDIFLLPVLMFLLLTAGALYLLLRFIERRHEDQRVWYRELFESNPHPMWVYDLMTLRFLDVNRAAVLHYGYTREEFLSMLLTDIRPPEEVPALLENVQRAREGSDHFGIWRHRRKDGSEFFVEVFSHRTNIVDRNSRMVLAQDITNRLAAERQLRENEAHFREMTENLGDIYYNYDLVNDRLLYVNENFARVWGRPLEPGATPNDHYLKGVHPEDLSIVLDATSRVRQGETTETEYRVVRPDGSVVWILEQARPLVDLAGKVYRIVGTMRDVTQRRQVEEVLRESQLLLRMAARVSRLGGWIIDLTESGPVFTWSEEVCAFLGLPADYRPPMETALRFFAPEHRPAIHRAIQECMDRGEAFDEQLELLAAGGRRVAVRAMGEAVVDGHGKVIRIQGALQDVTERQQAEHSLLQSQQRFYQLADAMPFMVWTGSPEGRVDFLNRVGSDYVGIPAGESPGSHWLASLHPDDVKRAVAIWWDAMHAGRAYEQEFRIRRHAGGEYRWHKITGIPMRDEHGQVVKWYGAGLDVHDIKEAEERANSLARRLIKTLESVTDAFFTMDKDWRFTYVNKEAERVLGRSRRELLGHGVWDEFPHALGTGFEQGYRHAMASGETVAFEAYYPDPIDKWFAVRAYPSASGLAVYFRDVTQARQDAQLREDNEVRMRMITKATNDLVWDHDTVSHTIWWGEGFERYFGAAPRDRTTDDRFWEDLIHPEDRERILAGLGEALASGHGWSAEYRIRCADGTYIPVFDRAVILRDAEGNSLRMSGGFTDLTERKRDEEHLRRLARELEEERGKLMVAQSVAKMGSWEMDLETLTVNMSEESLRLYGLDLSVNRPSHERLFGLLHPEDRSRVEQAYVDSFNMPGPHSLTHKVLMDDGSVKYMEQNWRIECDDTGKPVRALGTTQDITARVELEEQFRQAQKMEAVGRLAGGVAHDFNNMLTVIQVRAEQALRRLEPDSPLQETFREILEAAERSTGLTRQLLTYARRQAVEPRVVDLNQSIGAMQQMLQRLIGEDVTLTWLPGESLWPTRIDPAQVDQILANLCVNARDAIHDIGRIVIETQNITLDEEYCRNRSGHRPGDYVMIAVSDNGAGMDTDTRTHIFEPFYTTKEIGKGTGLGLATVYGIVQQNNGFLHVYSEPGEGTTFRIYLPALVKAEIRPPLVVPPREPPRGKGETILVVEDELMILEVAVEVLEGLGYHVLSTTSSVEALDMVESHDGRIDLLLTDVIMPGMNGRDLALRIRELRPDIHVLYTSGYTANVILTRGLVDQGDAFVQKPFSTNELALRVRALIDAPRV